MVFNMPDYVQARMADNYNFDDDEYSLTEHKAGEIADELAKFITGKGYKAISQSDTGLVADGVFNYETFGVDLFQEMKSLTYMDALPVWNALCIVPEHKHI